MTEWAGMCVMFPTVFPIALASGRCPVLTARTYPATRSIPGFSTIFVTSFC